MTDAKTVEVASLDYEQNFRVTWSVIAVPIAFVILLVAVGFGLSTLDEPGSKIKHATWLAPIAIYLGVIWFMRRDMFAR
jgi:hypothetical protein